LGLFCRFCIQRALPPLTIFPSPYFKDQLLPIALPISYPDTTVNRKSVQRFQSSQQKQTPPRLRPLRRATLRRGRIARLTRHLLGPHTSHRFPSPLPSKGSRKRH
jgi:hypothetical protein